MVAYLPNLLLDLVSDEFRKVILECQNPSLPRLPSHLVRQEDLYTLHVLTILDRLRRKLSDRVRQQLLDGELVESGVRDVSLKKVQTCRFTQATLTELLGREEMLRLRSEIRPTVSQRLVIEGPRQAPRLPHSDDPWAA